MPKGTDQRHDPGGGQSDERPDARTQEQKRADREYARKRQADFIRDVTSGATEEQLRDAGYGNFHMNNLALANEFGSSAMYSGLTIDILNRQVFDPAYGWTDKDGTYHRGQWRPMSEYPDLARGIDEYQNFKWSPEGEGWETAYSLPFQGYLVRDRLMKDVAAGHATFDPVSGMYFDVGRGNPNDPSTWNWRDKFNRPASPPSRHGAIPGGADPSKLRGLSVGGAIPGMPGGGGQGGGLSDLLTDNALTSTLGRYYGWKEVPGSYGTRRLPNYAKSTPGGGLIWGDADPGPFGTFKPSAPIGGGGAGGPSLYDVVTGSGAGKGPKLPNLDWNHPTLTIEQAWGKGPMSSPEQRPAPRPKTPDMPSYENY